MKRWFVGQLALCVVSSASAGTVLWDNYLTPGTGYDGVSALSSERNTVTADSWVADDAVFESPVLVDEVRWIGYREIGIGGVYATADMLIMDGSFNPVLELTDVDYSSTVLDTRVILGRTYEIYEGVVTLPVGESGEVDRELDPGHYYFGARLVGNGLGQNFFATTGKGEINGLTLGYTRSPSFHQNQWTPVDVVYGIQFDTDFAFQVTGSIVPEPVSFMMVACGGLFLLRRR